MRVDRIVDFGTVISLVGIDTETTELVTIHVDHRPFACFWQAWFDAGKPPPVEYEADRLLLRLTMQPAGEGSCPLIELDGHDAPPATLDQAAQDIGQ
ncbi:MAG: hypothetical protein JO001_21350 [Alphaproteobacteria bacterium]|nr:hypothetical protein [Alphaproteobacteria bacterium]